MNEAVTAPKALKQAQWLANLTDTAVRIPVIGVRVGLDFLVGLLPVIGDVIMFLVSLRIIWLARSMGVPRGLRAAMLRNCVLDWLLGLVPVVGDIIDIFFKANRANVRIMEQWWLQQHRQALRDHARESVESWEQDNA